MLTQIGHGDPKTAHHVIEDVAEQIEVRSLTENGEKACDVPAVGNGIFTLDTDEQTQRRIASKFFEAGFGGGVSENDGEEKDPPENGDRIGIASVVPSLLECGEQLRVGDGTQCVFDGGECGRDFEFVPREQGFGGLDEHCVLRCECVFGGVTRKPYPRNRGTGVEIAKSHRPDEINRLNPKAIGVTQFCHPHQHLQILAHAERAIASHLPTFQHRAIQRMISWGDFLSHGVTHMQARRDFEYTLTQLGQDAEIRRESRAGTKTKALVRDKQPCLEFALGTDIQAGDEVFLTLSEKLYTIERVEKFVFGTELVKLKAHHTAPPRHSQPSVVVHGSVINAHNISSSALQFHSPEATQTLTVNVGPDQTDKLKEAIRLILEILDELDLPVADKEEARSEAETADAQLKSPKPRWEWVRTSLSNLRDKVVAGMTEKVVPAVVAKAERAIEWITNTSNTGSVGTKFGG